MVESKARAAVRGVASASAQHYAVAAQRSLEKRKAGSGMKGPGHGSNAPRRQFIQRLVGQHACQFSGRSQDVTQLDPTLFVEEVFRPLLPPFNVLSGLRVDQTWKAIVRICSNCALCNSI